MSLENNQCKQMKKCISFDAFILTRLARGGGLLFFIITV